MYGNEKYIGRVLRELRFLGGNGNANQDGEGGASAETESESLRSRAQLFITTKIPPERMGAKKAPRCICPDYLMQNDICW